MHETPAGVPFGHVETYIVDHGKQYISTAVQEAARLLKSNLQLARIRTATDKAAVERVFRRVRTQFVQPLPGYKGPNLFERGTWKTVEGETFMFLWEIDQCFAEWVACDYQNTPHEGLQFQSCPDLDLTPNQAYDFGITRSGRLPVPPPHDLRVELLPTLWRRINHYGIEIKGVRYNGDVLNPFRNQRSPWSSKLGKWKVKVNRYDRSHIWFWAFDPNTLDPTVGSWERLDYRGWNECPLFGDEELDYAKAIILGNGGRVRNPFDLEPTLDRVLARLAEQRDLPTSERRMVGRTYLRALGSLSEEQREREWDDDSGSKVASGTPSASKAAPTPGEDYRDADLDEVDDLAFTTLDGPKVLEFDYFADSHPDADPDDLAGMENLADEPQEPW